MFGSAISPATRPQNRAPTEGRHAGRDLGHALASRPDPSAQPCAASRSVPVSLHARKIRLIMELRHSGVTDTVVLRAIERIPREDFVPPTFRDRAYDPRTLPIGCGQTLSNPQVVALMTQALSTDSRQQGAGDRHRVRLPGCRAGAVVAPCLHHRAAQGFAPRSRNDASRNCASTTSRRAMATAALAGPSRHPSTAS